MAGTVLLLTAPERVLPPQRGVETAEKEVLFDYFAAELFDKAPPDVQRMLTSTALLPEVSVAAATALSGEQRAGEILAYLVRRSYFTLRLRGAEPRYRYHPLFRDFLLARARRLGEPEWRELASKAASHLAGAGLADDAAAILLSQGAFVELAELALAQAPALAGQGRLATLGTWLGALPEPVVSAEPWLSYWLGVCAFLRPLEARAHFARANAAFEARNDLLGTLLAWSGAVGTFFYVWDEFAGLDPWIARLDDLQRRGMRFPSVEVETSVTLGALASLMWRAAKHPSLGHWVSRAEVLVESEAPAELRMQLAAYLSVYWVTWRGNLAAGDRVLARVRTLLEARDVSPLTQTFWYACDAHMHARRAEHAECFAAADRGLRIAEESGVHAVSQLLATQGVYGGLVAGDLEAARRYHAVARTFQGSHEKFNGALHNQLAAWIHLRAGDLQRAERHAATAVSLVEESGANVATTWFESTLAFVRLKRGELEQSVATFEKCIRFSDEIAEHAIRYHCELAIAWTRLVQGRQQEALERLRRALPIGREQEYVAPLWISWDKEVLATIAAFALEHGLETQFITQTIRACRLTPPPGAPESWPWPVRVRLLGGFELWRNGERVSFSGKVQRKPLDLLRAVALLGGIDVREAVVVDALWPDADGDRAAHSLETTAYRLRQLLGCSGALRQQDQRLSLDPRHCWIDAVALLERLDNALETAASDGADTIEMEANRVLALYRGPLIAFDEEQDEATDLSVVLRQKIRTRLTKFLRAAERRLAEKGAIFARGLAERARAVDPGFRL
jgi:LuxR family transcriptional regulator, maltose regulon positive regulatory protein